MNILLVPKKCAKHLYFIRVRLFPDPTINIAKSSARSGVKSLWSAQSVESGADSIPSQKFTKSRQVVATNLTLLISAPPVFQVNVLESLFALLLCVTLFGVFPPQFKNCVPSGNCPSKKPRGVVEPWARAWMRNPLYGAPIVSCSVTVNWFALTRVAVSEYGGAPVWGAAPCEESCQHTLTPEHRKAWLESGTSNTRWVERREL